MSIIVDANSRVVVQGITGNAGKFHATTSLNYGTKILAGITPGKGGQKVEGIPVYDTVMEAVMAHNVNTSVIFVPASSTRDAVYEAINSGIKTIVVITELIPQKDAIDFISRADKEKVIIIGPNTPGIINPAERIRIGIAPSNIFSPGSIGIVSRSGTLTYEIAWHISKAGFGQSTCIGIGGDAVVGLDYTRVLKMFLDDEETKGVVIIGEIGGDAEESAAEYIRETNYPKPVVAYIAGRTAPVERSMGHAGAIIMGNRGTAKSKIEALIAAGVPVAEKPSDMVKLLNIAMPDSH